MTNEKIGQPEIYNVTRSSVYMETTNIDVGFIFRKLVT